MEIKDYIQTGKQNATDSRHMADLLQIPQRTLQGKITEARLEGAPICATNNGKMGYYMAADADELREYCGRISHRAKKLFAVYGALVNTLHKMEIAEGRQITIFDYMPTQEERKEERTTENAKI